VCELLHCDGLTRSREGQLLVGSFQEYQRVRFLGAIVFSYSYSILTRTAGVLLSAVVRCDSVARAFQPELRTLRIWWPEWLVFGVTVPLPTSPPFHGARGISCQ
jgi:hypothetical protein